MKKRFPVECDDVRGTFLDPHRKKTINRVTQRLTPAVRDAIRTLWKTAGCMDLNYPDLATYLAVINQRFETTLKTNEAHKSALWDIQCRAAQGSLA